VQYHEGRKAVAVPIHTRALRLGGDTSLEQDEYNAEYPPSGSIGKPAAAQWKEARAVFPIYLALPAKQLEIEIPLPGERNLPEKPDLEDFQPSARVAGFDGPAGHGTSASPPAADDHTERQRNRPAGADSTAFAQAKEKQCGPG